MRRKTVGDRNRTAQRLLRSTAERSYDGEVDIDWDAPLDPEKQWIPEHRQSLYGTGLWDKLTQEQRDELGKHELVSVLSFGIYAEAGLSTMLLRMLTDVATSSTTIRGTRSPRSAKRPGIRRCSAGW